MGLGISTDGGGDFIPYLKYDAKAGRIFRSPNKDAGEKQAVDLTMNFVGAFDMANIEVGWMDFPSGQAPQIQVRPLKEGIGDKPPTNFKWKQGFRVRVALPGVAGVFDMTSSAKATISAFNELHDKIGNAPELLAGKVPVLALSGTEIVETQSPQGVQRNYKPVFTVQSWIDRPATMVVREQATPAATPAAGFSGPAPTGATTLNPPSTPTPPQVSNQANGFG